MLQFINPNSDPLTLPSSKQEKWYKKTMRRGEQFWQMMRQRLIPTSLQRCQVGDFASIGSSQQLGRGNSSILSRVPRGAAPS